MDATGEAAMNLDLLSTDDLLEELLSRFEHCAFAGMRPCAGGKKEIFRRYVGDYTVALGLLDLLKVRIVSDFREAFEPSTGEEA